MLESFIYIGKIGILSYLNVICQSGRNLLLVKVTLTGTPVELFEGDINVGGI